MTKELSVVNTPQGKNYVPSIRVAGKWLIEAGFNLGDKIQMKVENGSIIITNQNN